MNRIQALYATTIGKKFIAAITGIVLFGFLLGHVAGNLKVFTGETSAGVPHIDEYGHFLRIVGAPMVPEQFVLWSARGVLLVSLILHVVVVSQLALRSQSARPIGYIKSKKSVATLPAMYMMFSGLLILGFIIFHLLHFTTGTIVIGEFEHGYIYKNLSSSFSNPIVAIGYVFVMIVLGFHLHHGVWSLFQTLGLDNPDRNKSLRLITKVLTFGIIAGFIAIPLAFLLGQMPEAVKYSQELLTGH